MDVMMRMNIVNIVLYLLLLLTNIDNTLQLSLSKEGCYFQHFIIHPAKKKEKIRRHRNFHRDLLYSTIFIFRFVRKNYINAQC